MNSITLCMIVKDEEKNLRNCLNSVKDLVNEIIIVDTGSSDNTIQIAKEFTEKVFNLAWNNDFSKARNLSISKVSGDWILILDADEIISKEDCERIKKLIENAKSDAFLFTLRDYVNNTGVAGFISSKDDSYSESKIASGFYTAKILRLFRNKNYLFEGRIHETLHNSIRENNGLVFDSDIVIHHFGNLDKNKFIEKKNRNIELLYERLEKEDFIEKSKDRVCFELGRELINLNKIDEALSLFEEAVELKEDFEYLLGLGGLYLIKKRFNDAEKTLKKSILINPHNSSIHNNLGVVYINKKEYNKAIRKFERAIEINPKSADAYFNLGQVYREIGKKDKMKRCFDEAVELNPKYREKIKSLS